MADQKKLEELTALKFRLEHDIRMSRALQVDGLSRNSPLLQNHEKVLEEIRKLQKA